MQATHNLDRKPFRTTWAACFFNAHCACTARLHCYRENLFGLVPYHASSNSDPNLHLNDSAIVVCFHIWLPRSLFPIARSPFTDPRFVQLPIVLCSLVTSRRKCSPSFRVVPVQRHHIGSLLVTLLLESRVRSSDLGSLLSDRYTPASLALELVIVDLTQRINILPDSEA